MRRAASARWLTPLLLLVALLVLAGDAAGQATPQIQTFQCSSGCAAGQYVIEACDAVAGRDWLCAECSTCEEGSVVEKPCSGEENTECRPCSVCGDGEVELEACRNSRDTICEPVQATPVAQVPDMEENNGDEAVNCGSCAEGQFLIAKCDEVAGKDRECRDCSMCGDDEEVVSECRDDHDTECVAVIETAVECGSCPDGQFATRECDVDAGEDRLCRACSERCGEGVVDCIADGKGDALCSRCNFGLFGGGLYAADGDGDGYGECKFCSPCQEGEYLKTPCSGFVDNVCDECSECADGEEVAACSAEADTVCKANENDAAVERQTAVECGPCPDGQFVTRECDEDAGEDRQCRACSDRCGEGVMDCIADGRGDALCSRCNFGDGLYAADLDGDGYGECKFCSPCEEDEYLKTPCSGFVDNVCEECSECADDEEEAEACSAEADTVCAAVEKVEEAVRAGRPKVSAKTSLDRMLTVQMGVPSGHLEEELLVAYVYRLNHFDADELSEPNCDGIELKDDEYGDIVAAPTEVTFDEEWVSLAVRLCPKPGTSTYTPSRVDRGVRSACSCYNVQYAVEECNPESGGVVQCALCENCGTTATSGGFGQCRGPSEDDCLVCGGTGLELEVVDGEAGRCVEPVKECDNVCEGGYYLDQPCDDRGNKECLECNSCDGSSDGEDMYEVRACDSLALVDGNAVCAVMQEAPVPEVVQSVSETAGGDIQLNLGLKLPDGDGSFDKFFIVYSLHEGEDDYDDIEKPDCDDTDNRVDNASDSLLLLDSVKWWGVGLRACPRDTLKGYKISNSVKLVVSACSCRKGWYPDVPCSPADGGAGNLATCAECDQCGDGGECVGPGVGDCSKCGNGDMFFLPTNDKQGLGECRSCSEECPAGQYRTGGCSDSSDITCKKCSPECGPDQVEVVGCGDDKDRQCLSRSDATAPVPVIEDGDVLFDRRGRLEVRIELKGVSYDDFEIGYAWVPGDDLATAPVPVCDPDDPNSVNFSDEDVELKRDEDWITVSAITCPKEHVKLLRSEVVSWVFSACHCPVGSFVSKECERDGPIRECERCRECDEGEEEVSPCEGGRDRVCAPPEAVLPRKGQLPMPIVQKGWSKDGRFNIQITPPEDDSKFVLFKTAVVTEDLEAEALALADCDTRLEDTTTENMVSGSLTSGASSPKVLNFARDAVVEVSAIACPVSNDAFFPSKALTKQLSLCECGPNEYEVEACDDVAGVASNCAGCEEKCGGEGGVCLPSTGECTSCGGDSSGVYLAAGECAACTTTCEEGSFMLTPCTADADATCQACTECADGEVVVSPCTDGTDTVCEAAPTVPVPLVTVSAASLQAIAAGDPALVLSVDLPSTSGDDWSVAFTSKAAATDDDARSLLDSLPDPVCGDEASNDFIDVDGMRSTGEYGWLAVKAVACPNTDVAINAAREIQSEMVSLCSCPTGSYPSRSCDLSRGTAVQCTQCANDECPTILPPPIVSPAGLILPKAGQEAEVTLHGSPGTTLRYIVNESAAIPDYPCNSTSPLFNEPAESPATIALPVGKHIIRAFSCAATSANSVSYTRTTSVVVHEAFKESEEGEDARVGAVDIITLKPAQLVELSNSNAMSVENTIAMQYANFIKGGLRAAELDGDVVTIDVREESSSHRKLSQETNATTAAYQVSYFVVTTADNAKAIATFLESQLRPGTASARVLASFLAGAEISSHASELLCSVLQSRDCEVEWTYVAPTCSAILDVGSPIRCGMTDEGYVLTPAGKCGSCPSCPANTCTAVKPCPECECTGGCGSTVAVSQDGPGREDRVVDGNREKVVSEDGVMADEQPPQFDTTTEIDEALDNGEGSAMPGWIWIAVGAGISAIALAGVVMGGVCMWRRRKSKGAENERDFTFSSVYEDPRGQTAKNSGSPEGMNGETDSGEVHVTVTDNNGSGIRNDDSVELTLTDSEMDEDIPQDML